MLPGPFLEKPSETRKKRFQANVHVCERFLAGITKRRGELMKRPLVLLLCLAVFLASAGLAYGATNAQKQLAIDKGLAHLATIQNSDGSWGSPWYYPVAHTASALLAFTEQYYKPTGWNGQNYLANVQKAADYLFQTAQKLIFPQARSGNQTGARAPDLSGTAGKIFTKPVWCFPPFPA
jgi:hypothetical protein